MGSVPQIAFWMVVGAGLSMGMGCASVGVTGEVPFPGVAAFDQALMAYARGELDEAERKIQEALHVNPDDLRVRELWCAILQETGSEEDCSHEVEPPTFSSPLTPEALLHLVMQRNPEIRQAVLRVVATRAQLREAQVSFGPELMILTRFHPAGIFARLIQSVLSGLIEREALMDQAEAELLHALGEYARVRADLVARTASAYLDLREAETELRYLTKAVEVGSELERVAAVLHKYGLLSQADYREIQAEASKIPHALLRLRGRVTTASAELAGLIGIPEATPLTVAAKSIAVESPENVRTFFETVANRHPRLVAARARVEGAQARKKVLLWSLPRVDLRGTYGSSVEKGRGDFLEGLSIGLRVRTPLLVWPLQRARSAREDAFIGILEREVERVRNELWVSAVAAVQRLKDVQQQYQIAQHEARTKRMAWKAMEMKDRFGIGRDTVETLRAKLAWIEAERQAVRHRFAVQHAQVQVHVTMGALPRDLVFVSEPEESALPKEREVTGSLPQGKRALWVWRPSFLDKAEDREFFLEFLMARHINAIFLFASRAKLENNPLPFRAFLRLAHARGVDVHALNGEPTWIFPGREAAVTTFFEVVDRFNREGELDERFDAVHLDVEIAKRHLRAQPEVIADFVKFIESAYREADRRAMRLVLDIPVWFDEVPVGSQTLLDSVVRPGSELVMMAYHKNQSRALQLVQEERAALEKVGGTLWMGISADPRHLRATRLLPGAQFEKRLNELEQLIGDRPVFKGIAIHDYDRYRDVILLTPLTHQANKGNGTSE